MPRAVEKVSRDIWYQTIPDLGLQRSMAGWPSAMPLRRSLGRVPQRG